MASSATATAGTRGRLRAATSPGSIAGPAVKAYAVGYVFDVLPTILKLHLRFFNAQSRVFRSVSKRVREERQIAREEKEKADGGKPNIRISHSDASAQTSLYQDAVLPALRQLPHLWQQIGRAMIKALGIRGMAIACALSMLATATVDKMLTRTLRAYLVGAQSGSARLAAEVRLKVISTFTAATISSFFALTLLQKGQAALRSERSGGYGAGSLKPKTHTNPTPLAPAGHILARFTALSIPASPSGTERNTPILDDAPTFRPQPQSPSSPSPSDQKDGGVSPPALDAAAGEEDDAEEAAAEAAQRARVASKNARGRPSSTIDLTLFALVRAMDTLLRSGPTLAAIAGARPLPRKGSSAAPAGRALGPSGGLATHAAASAKSAGKRPASNGRSLLSKLGGFVSDQAEGLTFVVSCAVIMWSWFYHPERLPPTYVKWISGLAEMDESLLTVLRAMRYDKPFPWIPGEPNSPEASALVGQLSVSLGHPFAWGDPSQQPRDAAHAREMLAAAKKRNAELRAAGKPVEHPANYLKSKSGEPGFVFAGASGPRGRGEMGGMPCEVVHCGRGGGNCFANAGLRWLKAWRTCMGIYIPVHLLPRILFGTKAFMAKPAETLIKVLRASARSAAFLATFTSSVWFMVCLTRSVIGPRLFPNMSSVKLDRGVGQMLGVWVCGTSIWILPRGNRPEMALYVAPRALYAAAEMFKPGWISGGQSSALWAERAVFALSMGAITVTAQMQPSMLKGATAIMSWVYKNPQAAAVRKVVKA